MTELEDAILALEYGLLKVTRGGKQVGKKMELSRRMAYYKVPGFSIAFVDQENLAWARGFGEADVDDKKPVTTETLFQAASISKPVTAMVALHLVEAGLLDLDADANDTLRSWKIPKSKHTLAGPNGVQPKVTLRGLLSHSAGMNIHGYAGYPSDSQLPTLQQILNGKPPANSKPVRVASTPGKAIQYSGGGYLVVQQMVEDLTGKPLAVLAKEYVFDKLGMANSTFDYPLPQTQLPKAATAHSKTGERMPGKWHTYPEQAAAGLWTTPSDLARLLIEVLKSYKKEESCVLSSEMTCQMLTPQMSTGGLGYFIAIKNGMTTFGHPGQNFGFRSLLLGCLETGQGVIWMANGENGRQLGREVMRGLDEVVGWTWW